MNAEPDLAVYLREAASWDGDRVAQAERSTRHARLLAVAFALIAIVALGAVATLTPLKTVEPYLIRVDSTSGIVDVVPVYAGGVALGDTVTRYLLTHYVSTCERFALAVAEQDYAECGSFHSPMRNQAWASQWATGNPDSPLNRYRDGTTVRADVLSVSFFTRASGLKDLAQVRFIRTTNPGGSGAAKGTHWIATIQYAYGKPSSDTQSRRWNPLGFRILDYRLEPEVTDSAATPAGAAP